MSKIIFVAGLDNRSGDKSAKDDDESLNNVVEIRRLAGLK